MALNGEAPVVRTFETGANRDVDTGKLDFEGFLSPLALTRFAEYMHKNRLMRDGSLRDSDNWQRGIPLDVYMKSMFRHFMKVWSAHRNGSASVEELCALMFNVQGYLHETLKTEASRAFGWQEKGQEVNPPDWDCKCRQCSKTPDEPFTFNLPSEEEE